jgi:septal ring factor EnvC (AmiA/AmiB activator)
MLLLLMPGVGPIGENMSVFRLMSLRPVHVTALLGFCLCAVAALAGAMRLSSGDARAQERVQREDAQEQLRAKQRELEAARQREQKLAGDIEKLNKERAQLNENLIDTARRIQLTEENLTRIEARLDGLASQERDVRSSIAARHASISHLLAAMQRIGRQPPPALVTRRSEALKMVRSAMLMASVFSEFKFQAEGLSAELDSLVRLGEGIRLQRDNLKAENEKLIAYRDRIGGLIGEKQAMAQAQQEKLQGIRVAAAQHAKSVTYLGELVKRMDKEIAAAGVAAYEAELAAKRAREKEVGKKAESQKVAFVSPGRLKPAMEFVDTRGKLARPVSGRVVRVYGGTNDVGETVKGISILSRANAQVTSPVDGWVAYADEFRTYGQLLIINAGGGYHILLAGMQRIDVNVGQFILAGEPVAVMGEAQKRANDRGSGQGPILYVEFRKDGRPIDPSPWWAKSPERVEG